MNQSIRKWLIALSLLIFVRPIFLMLNPAIYERRHAYRIVDGPNIDLLFCIVQLVD
jgi:hypothetical protein